MKTINISGDMLYVVSKNVTIYTTSLIRYVVLSLGLHYQNNEEIAKIFIVKVK